MSTTAKTDARVPKARSTKKAAAKTVRRAGKPARERAGNVGAGAETRSDGLRKGSKMAIMLDMVLKPEGATEAAICKKLGWKKCRVTLTRVCARVGAVLEHSKPKEDGPTVYKATIPPKKG